MKLIQGHSQPETLDWKYFKLILESDATPHFGKQLIKFQSLSLLLTNLAIMDGILAYIYMCTTQGNKTQFHLKDLLKARKLLPEHLQSDTLLQLKAGL